MTASLLPADVKSDIDLANSQVKPVAADLPVANLSTSFSQEFYETLADQTKLLQSAKETFQSVYQADLKNKRPKKETVTNHLIDLGLSSTKINTEVTKWKTASSFESTDRFVDSSFLQK